MAIAVTLLYLLPEVSSAGPVLSWSKRFDGAAHHFDYARDVAVDPSDNVIVTGYAINSDITSNDIVTLKYNGADGRLLWKHVFDGTIHGSDQGNAVAVDGQGNVFVTGFTSQLNGTTDLYVAKYGAANGATRWEKIYNAPFSGNDGGVDIEVDEEGDAYVTGFSQSKNGEDYYTAKYDGTDGHLLWSRRSDGPGHGNDRPVQIACDGADGVVVTGTCTGDGTLSDIGTWKYDAASGIVVWERRYDGPTHGDDYCSAMALDAVGNVSVIGSSTGAANLDLFFIQYNVKDGAVLGNERFDGPTHNVDQGVDIKVNQSNGNVVVTGSSPKSKTTGLDWINAEYKKAARKLFEEYWQKPVVTQEEDRPVSLVINATGNPIVTGYSAFGPGDTQIVTTSYSSPDGQRLWTRYFGGSSFDTPSKLVLDSAGNIIITGFSYNAAGNSDFRTIKYLQRNNVP